MAAVTDVTIASGVPTVGTGTVATLSKFEKAASSGTPAASDVALAVTVRDVNVNGSATSANSAPVVIASDQAWPVSTIGFMKKEDVASADGDAGIPAMAIQKATPADTAGTDGDYAMVQMSAGRVWTSANAVQDTSTISNGSTNLTPKFKVITASSSGATTIVAAVTSKKIRVLAWDVKVNAAVNFKWQSHVTPTDLTGLYYNAGQGDGVARAFNPVGYFETVAGEALDINLSGAVAVGGVLTYVEV